MRNAYTPCSKIIYKQERASNMSFFNPFRRSTFTPFHIKISLLKSGILFTGARLAALLFVNSSNAA